MSQEKKYQVEIRWGGEETREENPDEYSVYTFDTEAELNAFLLGVTESNEWMDYEIVKDNDKEEIP